MIELRNGNLLKADAEALVNTVNCVGVMGKGIALQFKQAYPDNFKEYARACKSKLVVPGSMFTVQVGGMLANPRYIINFPTKRHWKGNSRIEDIESGLKALIAEVKRLGIRSIAVPPLGCGNGGLVWDEVRPKIVMAFEDLPNVNLFLYEPTGNPPSEEIKVATKKNLTNARALLLELMNRYTIPGYTMTLLVVQKLAYFLQEAGEPLKLNFEKGIYGPYAENLNFVLKAMEGHYTRGLGDGSRKKDAPIYLLPKAASEASEFLMGREESLQRLDLVTDIIAGFESPYGMELLATVDWVMKQNPETANDFTKVKDQVYIWNKRKRDIFKENHISIAWKHLSNIKVDI
ncbi:MAG: macro domain-containing protein [Peptococcaceae bacterium]|nr:macro domain-containing protein [Peptococcaceae bacterium]